MRRKNKQKHDEEMSESWLLPYADLLTLLLALFIVLFAMSEINVQKYEDLAAVFKSEFSGGKGPMKEGSDAVELKKDSGKTDEKEKKDAKQQELEHLQTLQMQINGYIEERNLTEAIATKLTDEGLLISILTDVTFESGRATVNDDGKKIAKEVSAFLVTNPPHEIVISGHADDRPIHNAVFASNWELSVIRAVNFMKLVLENKELDPERFSAKGFGDNRPIVPNTTTENMAKNRRVEVLILPNVEITTDKATTDDKKQETK
ncbi:flagellar motor protein MotB [Virgibacillus sp. LDC-1]|uniref:flagellar motor protein MotB n=1 Tax=Virgibacillus sp. LDC-1 TaxID=3039856 RepID=UPI0024DE972F|nr:flagellar motor protein MotB [Virgibacillus sp. LDC-1]